MDGYSKTVAWLKVILPLAALVLLSTVFLLSRNTDPAAAIPFADAELRTRLDGQQVTGPTFEGTSNAGDRVTVSAGSMATRGGAQNTANDLRAQIDLAGGTRVILSAKHGTFDLTGGATSLDDQVEITTSTGYALRTDTLLTDLENMTIRSPGPVQGQGLFGQLDAGQMDMSKSPESGNTQLVFKNGVKLVYDPSER